MPTKNDAEMVIRDFAGTWKEVSLGWLEMTDMSGVVEKFAEKKIGEAGGDVVIDQIFIGLEGTIKTTHKQVKLETYRQLKQDAAGSGAVTGTPALYSSKYAQAGLLKLHPKDMGADTSEDFNFLKVAPKNVTLPKSAQGKAFIDMEVEWFIFPDKAAYLADPAVLRYYWIGDVPA
jgi:hypothetical protein